MEIKTEENKGVENKAMMCTDSPQSDDKPCLKTENENGLSQPKIGSMEISNKENSGVENKPMMCTDSPQSDDKPSFKTENVNGSSQPLDKDKEISYEDIYKNINKKSVICNDTDIPRNSEKECSRSNTYSEAEKSDFECISRHKFSLTDSPITGIESQDLSTHQCLPSDIECLIYGLAYNKTSSVQQLQEFTPSKAVFNKSTAAFLASDKGIQNYSNIGCMRDRNSWDKKKGCYDNQAMWKNKLSQMNPKISNEIGLSYRHTNHCIKATVGTGVNLVGVDNLTIMSITGHRIMKLLESYVAGQSDAQRCAISLILQGVATPSIANCNESKGFSCQLVNGSTSLSKNSLSDMNIFPNATISSWIKRVLRHEIWDASVTSLFNHLTEETEFQFEHESSHSGDKLSSITFPQGVPKPVLEQEPVLESEPEQALEPEPVVEQERDLEPEPVVKQEQALEPEPVVEQEQGLQLEPVEEPEQALEPEPVVEQEQALELEPVVEQEQALEPEPMVELEQALQPEPVVEQEQALEPEPVVELEQALEPDLEPVEEPEKALESEPVVEPEQSSEPEPVVKPEQSLEPEPVVEPEQALEPEPVVEPEQALESDPVVEPEQVLESETMVEPEQAIESEPVVEPEQAIEPEQALEPEPVVEPESPLKKAKFKEMPSGKHIDMLAQARVEETTKQQTHWGLRFLRGFFKRAWLSWILRVLVFLCVLANHVYSDSANCTMQMCDTGPNNLRLDRGLSELFQATVNMKPFSPKLEVTPLDRNSSKRFIVRIQSGREYPYYDPHSKLMVYNQTVTFDITLSNPKLYHLCNECGVLAEEKLTVKKIFCWASFKNKGKTICFHTDNLPPFQTW
ncbi:Hypothetical predicted protein [Mytilus galloprovincialis]|uniref:Uncharacterized protein n=1 Tax=Mytilus galloprovincialis TaxID=29158 RepID=A0A8B6C2G9_MYTGA|nr:Hypothetical predicted protein [Mytilus galloprovincialis]